MISMIMNCCLRPNYLTTTMEPAARDKFQLLKMTSVDWELHTSQRLREYEFFPDLLPMQTKL